MPVTVTVTVMAALAGGAKQGHKKRTGTWTRPRRSAWKATDALLAVMR